MEPNDAAPETQEPLFIVEPTDKENVAKRYNRLIASDCRNPLSCMKAYIYHKFACGGHVIMLAFLSSAKERYRASALAFDDHLLVQDDMLRDIEKSGRHEWGWDSEFALKGGFRTIGDRVACRDGQEYVRFDYDEIVAAFYSRDIIVLRFCWGENSWDNWDVIIGSGDFTKGSLDALLDMIEPAYKDKPTTDDMEAYKRSKVLRLTSYSANPQMVGSQYKVRIYGKRKSLFW